VAEDADTAETVTVTVVEEAEVEEEATVTHQM
jgi:hypothetical protein